MSINEITTAIKNINLDQEDEDKGLVHGTCVLCKTDNTLCKPGVCELGEFMVCGKCAGRLLYEHVKEQVAEKKIECNGCHTMFSPTDLNAIGLTISLCNKCYCQKKLNESYERCATLKAEHKANLQIIKDKVKGKIRAAQSRNKEIREMLKGEEYSRDQWNNGGVW